MKNTSQNRTPFLSARIVFKCVAALAAVVFVSLLSACSSGKVINTVDDSVEYRKAQTLPPLKKNSRVITSDVPATESRVTVESEDVVAESTPLATEEQNATANDVADSGSVITTESIAPDSDSSADTSIGKSVSARVVSAGSNYSRLEINTGFDQAWEYLTDNLQRSDVTIFSRNKAAGRLSIGCAGIDNGTDDILIEKQGRWSFFNRDKLERLEYCALEAVSKRDSTNVKVLNRSGQEILTESSTKVFERILNN